MNKKWGGGLLIVALLAILFSTKVIPFLNDEIFTSIGPAQRAADEFLKLCGRGKIPEAYQSTSDSLQILQDEKSFAFQVRQLALDQFETSFWVSRTAAGNEATFKGEFQGKDGLYYEISVRLSKEKDIWKVSRVKVFTFEMPKFRMPLVPNETELRKLATETFLQLNKAIMADDINLFYDKIAEAWKQQITSEKLATTFQEFFKNKVDFSDLGNLNPVFEPPPSLNENAILLLNGKFEHGEARLSFRLQYLLEGKNWKLIGLHIQIGKIEPEKKRLSKCLDVQTCSSIPRIV